ncbi:hypothetical protein MLD38_018083 [Melastoma candidum]|nr:hypothetical protein MLD38_018083 [Melastoma candidum]
MSYDPLDVSLSVQVRLRLLAKRWRRAYLAIYCSRAISSPRYRKNIKLLYPRPSFAAIPIDEDDPVLLSKSAHGIGKSQLADLVKSKDLKALKNRGGVMEIASLLCTDLESGINPATPEDVSSRREAFGGNTYERPRARGFFSFVLDGFKDMTIMILLFCAALSLGFGIKENGIKEGWYDGGSIFVAVFLVIVVSAVSNFRQSRQFEKLSEVSGNIPVDVVRDGRRQKVSIFEIVVGDVVFLKIGDQVPADGLFIAGHSLQIDESSMTGESDHVEVTSVPNPFLYSGTKVADGYGRMLVTSVGMSTTWGEMMSSISRDTNEQTPLQARLNDLTSSIGKLGLAVAFLVLVVLLIRFFTGNTYDENGNQKFTSGVSTSDDIINGVVGIVAAAVTIVVVAIPEGLPLAVTLTLAYSMKRMMKDQAMVRKLAACETMGSATTICTDKTGTLTMNQMMVTTFNLGNESIAEGHNHSSISSYVLDLIRAGIALNTMGNVYKSSSGASDYEFSGSPTEKAILCWAVTQLGMDIDKEKRNYEIIQVEAFNSSKKRSGVSLIKRADGTHHVHWKGAAEMVLAMCSSFYNSNGIEKELIGYERTKLEQIIESMAARSLRCIAFAHGRESESQPKGGKEERLKEDGLTLLGLIGIKDPCRPGVKTAVQACQDAGVNIKMITGDNVFTAKAIATECGILKPGDEKNDCAVIEGSEFRNLSPQARLERAEKIRVMARSSPFDKLLMVQCLKQMGHVVAVTGDGTNDAPALKEADIGLSMGIQGTEVAKESSDVVILDDNFATVTTVLRWGRCVYTNIQKFLQFQLTVNIAALVINFVAAVSSGSVPLTAVQLLWVNLIMDTLGAPGPGHRAPNRGANEEAPGESILGVSQATNRTVIFNTFVLCQVFNEFNAREIERRNVFEGLHRNRLFVGIVAGTVVLQVVMVEFLKRFANTERLSWGLWGICVAIAAASWPIGWIVKCVPVPRTPIFASLRLNLAEAREKFLPRK